MEDKGCNKKIRERYGFEYFGPFLLGYVKWLDEITKRDGVEKIFFLSRDGFMMQAAYKEIKGSLPNEYVYFSRQSIRQALLCRETNYINSLKYLTKERYISTKKILHYYGFKENECKKVADENGLELEKEYKYSELQGAEEFERFYYSNKNLINNRSKTQEELLARYLGQIGLSGNCAIVDIGWHGSMQFYLEKFCENEHIEIKLHGYYVGINPIERLDCSVEGYLFSPNDLSLRKEVLCFLGGYEKLFQSCEGSTIGYIQNGNIIEPIRQNYEYSLDGEQVEIISVWQEKAIAYVRQHCNATGNNWESYAHKLINFGKNPPKWGIEMFKDFYLMDGGKQYFVSQKRLTEYRPKELIHTISNSIWKTGFMKSLFKIPLPYYQIYKALRK